MIKHIVFSMKPKPNLFQIYLDILDVCFHHFCHKYWFTISEEKQIFSMRNISFLKTRVSNVTSQSCNTLLMQPECSLKFHHVLVCTYQQLSNARRIAFPEKNQSYSGVQVDKGTSLEHPHLSIRKSDHYKEYWLSWTLSLWAVTCYLHGLSLNRITKIK